MLVVFGDVISDRFFQVRDAAKHAAADSPGGDFREEAFDLVDPRSTGRREVDVVTRSPREPASDLIGFMGGAPLSA